MSNEKVSLSPIFAILTIVKSIRSIAVIDVIVVIGFLLYDSCSYYDY